MSELRITTLRTTAVTPWGFIGLAQTTLPEVNPITLEEARKDNLRVAADRLVPQVTFPGTTVRTPTADTTITVTERIVIQDPMADDDSGDVIEALPEYEIPFWKMTG